MFGQRVEQASPLPGELADLAVEAVELGANLLGVTDLLPQAGFGFAGTQDRVVGRVECGGESRTVDDVLVALAAEQAALRRRQPLQASEQLATVLAELEGPDVRGV